MLMLEIYPNPIRAQPLECEAQVSVFCDFFQVVLMCRLSGRTGVQITKLNVNYSSKARHYKSKC